MECLFKHGKNVGWNEMDEMLTQVYGEEVMSRALTAEWCK